MPTLVGPQTSLYTCMQLSSVQLFDQVAYLTVDAAHCEGCFSMLSLFFLTWPPV